MNVQDSKGTCCNQRLSVSGVLRCVAQPEHADCDQRVHREPGCGRLPGHPSLPSAHPRAERLADLVPGRRYVQDSPLPAGWWTSSSFRTWRVTLG